MEERSLSVVLIEKLLQTFPTDASFPGITGRKRPLACFLLRRGSVVARSLGEKEVSHLVMATAFLIAAAMLNGMERPFYRDKHAE